MDVSGSQHENTRVEAEIMYKAELIIPFMKPLSSLKNKYAFLLHLINLGHTTFRQCSE